MHLKALILAAGLIATSFGTAMAGPTDGCGLPPGSEQCETWSTKVNGGGGVFVDTVVSSAGDRVFATGTRSSDLLTAAFDSAGSVIWSVSYNGPASASDQAVGMTLSPDGSVVYVAGTSQGLGTGNDYVTIAYGAETGAQPWVARYSGPFGGNTAVGIDSSGDGARIYVSGYGHSNAGGSSYDTSTVAYDAATGAQLWVKSFDGPAKFWDIVRGMDAGSLQTASGTKDAVVVTMRSNVQGTGNHQVDFVTVAYDGANGQELWTSFYNGPSNDRDEAFAVAISPDGSQVYVLGEVIRPSAAQDYGTVALDPATGALVWTAFYDSGFGWDRPLGIAVAPAGDRIFVTGFTPNQQGILGALDRSATTIGYRRDGSQMWISKNTRVGGEAASSISVSPDGDSVSVAGLTVGQAVGGGADVSGLTGTGGPRYLVVNGFLTISYQADSGAKNWVARYPDPGSARAVTLSPDGTTSYVAGGGSDAVLIAYN